MNATEFINTLIHSGWIKEGGGVAHIINPPEIKLPPEIEALCSQYNVLRNSGDTAWFYSMQDYSTEGESAFEWNFFEKSSLECAVNEHQKLSVLKFWHEHMPFGASVADGYSYIAYRMEDGAVVLGNEPEYEESARLIASSLEEFFKNFIQAVHGKPNELLDRVLGRV